MRYRLLISIILITSTLAVFSPVRNYDFVTWDDNFHVYENPYLNPVSVENTLHFWQEPYKRLYTPVTYTFWSFLGGLSRFFPAAPDDSAVFDPEVQTLRELSTDRLNPHIFHTANLVLHLLNALIVFSFLRLLLTYGFRDGENERKNRDTAKIDLAAGLGALIFALHPVQVEPVAWVTGMKDMLSCMLSLLAVREYLAYSIAAKGMNEIHNKRVHYILASIAYILAVLAKPVAVVLPLVVLILDRWAVKRSIRDIGVSLVGWFIFAGLFAVIAKTVQQSGADIISTPLWARPFIAGDVLAFYFYKLVFPLQLGIDYGRMPAYVLQHFWGYATWLVPMTLLVVTLFIKRRATFLVPLGIFVASLLPVLGFIKFEFQNISTVADRYLYFSMLSVAMAVSLVLLNQKTKRVAAVFGLIIVLLAVRSSFQVHTWSENSALYTNALKINPASFSANNNMGLELVKNGELDEAISHYKKALKIKPNAPHTYNNIGLALTKKGEPDEAVAYYKAAVKFKPDFAAAHNNIGLALTKKGNPGEAIAHFKAAVKIKPDLAAAHNNIGLALVKKGNPGEAIFHYEKALKVRPNLSTVHYNLALALTILNRPEEAITHYKEAVKIEPGNEKAHNNLGIALNKEGKPDEAITYFKAAVKIKPDYAIAHNNLGIVLEGQGKLSEGIVHYKKSVQILPGDVNARYKLGVAFAKMGNYQKAADQFAEVLRIRPDFELAKKQLAKARARLRKK